MNDLPACPVAELPPERPQVVPPLPVQLLVLGVIIVPLLGLAAALVLLWESGVSWTDMGLLLGMYLLTALGVTVGFHRLITHRSFETYEWVTFALAAFGAMAVQGSMLQWVALHRRHHQHSDTPDDPHTPHHSGRGISGVLRGAWHAHIGWLFAAVPTDLDDYIKDLTKSRSLRVADALWPVWIVLGLAIPGLIGGLVKGSWLGVWTGLEVWGGLVRILLVHHVTWSVNSVCHLWGSRPYNEPRTRAATTWCSGFSALGRGLAQHPPCLPDFRAARAALAAN